MLKAGKSAWVLLCVLLAVWIVRAIGFPTRHQSANTAFRHGVSGEVSRCSTASFTGKPKMKKKDFLFKVFKRTSLIKKEFY